MQEMRELKWSASPIEGLCKPKRRRLEEREVGCWPAGGGTQMTDVGEANRKGRLTPSPPFGEITQKSRRNPRRDTERFYYFAVGKVKSDEY